MSDEFSPEELLAQLRQREEQAAAGVGEMAAVIYAFHRSLLEAGFNEGEAMVLTREMLANLTGGQAGE